jgi:hypothetical protein
VVEQQHLFQQLHQTGKLLMEVTHSFKVVVKQESMGMVVVMVEDTLEDLLLVVRVVLVVVEVRMILVVHLFTQLKAMLAAQDKILEVLFKA